MMMIFFNIFMAHAHIDFTKVDLSLRELPAIIEGKAELNRRKIRIYSEILGSSWLFLLEEKMLENQTHPYAKFNMAVRKVEKKEFQKAVDLLNEVYNYSPIYQEAMKLKAFAHFQLGENEAGLKSLELCEQTDMAISEEVKNQTYVSLVKQECILERGRFHFQQNNYEAALNAYNQIDFNSLVWPHAILEKSWSHFHLKQFSQSLGVLTAYSSPLLKHHYSHEVLYLKSLNYFKLCLYDEAWSAVQDMKRLRLNEAPATFIHLHSHGIQHLKNIVSDFELAMQLSGSDHLKGLQEKLNVRISKIEEQYRMLVKEKNDFFHSRFFNLELTILQQKRKYHYNPYEQKNERLGKNQSTSEFESWDFEDEFWIDEIKGFEAVITNKC